MEATAIDQAAVAAFGRDGVVCIRQVLGPQEVAAAAAAIDAVLARPGPLAQVASAAGDPGVSSRISAGGGRYPRSGSWPGTRGSRRWPRR